MTATPEPPAWVTFARAVIRFTSTRCRAGMMYDFVSTAPLPERTGSSRAGSTDTRGHSFNDILVPVGDLITAITSITVARRDGNEIGADDLTITPSGYAAPWLTKPSWPPTWGSPPLSQLTPTSTGTVVNWWFNSNVALATNGLPVDYQITITCTTQQNRTLVQDIYMTILPAMG